MDLFDKPAANSGKPPIWMIGTSRTGSKPYFFRNICIAKSVVAPKRVTPTGFPTLDRRGCNHVQSEEIDKRTARHEIAALKAAVYYRLTVSRRDRYFPRHHCLRHSR